MWKIFLCYSIYLTIILLINLDQFARHCFNSLNPPQAWFGYSGHLHFQTKTIWVTCPRSHSQYQRRCSFSGFTDNNHLQHSVSFLKQNFSVCVLSPIWLFAAAQTAACQAPLSMGFSRQEYWSGLPFPSPGDLPKPGDQTCISFGSSIPGRLFTLWAIGEDVKPPQFPVLLSVYIVSMPFKQTKRNTNCYWFTYALLTRAPFGSV